MNHEIELLAEAARKVQQQLTKMTEAEADKRQALLKHDLEQLESLLQTQQAMVMQLESLEARRAEAQRAAGYGEMKADELLLAVGAEEHALLEPIFRQMKQAAEDYRQLNAVSLDIANTEMRILNGAIAAAGAPGSGLYQKGGKKDGAAHGVTFTEKV